MAATYGKREMSDIMRNDGLIQRPNLALFRGGQNTKPLLAWLKGASSMAKQGSGLLSHPVSRAVPSVLEGLTSVFGMGTGVSPPL
jgi:hypothetical protein